MGIGNFRRVFEGIMHVIGGGSFVVFLLISIVKHGVIGFLWIPIFTKVEGDQWEVFQHLFEIFISIVVLSALTTALIFLPIKAYEFLRRRSTPPSPNPQIDINS